MVVSLYIVATLLFILFRVTPGQPAAVFVDPSLPQEAREALIRQYGLNQPLHIQYIKYLQSIIEGNMGMSYNFNEPVFPLVVASAINTIVLTLSAVLLAYLLGPIIGALLAWNRNTKLDTLGVGGVLVMRAAPVFWVGMMAIMVFSFQLDWLPSGGMTSPGITEEGIQKFLTIDFLRHLLLPLITIMLYQMSVPALVMRNNMIETLGADFIEMARAEGFPEWKILYKHAARNSLLPVFHYTALAIGFAFGGSVVIETVFSWPGLGRLMWRAVGTLDYPLAQGSFLMLSTMIIFMNFLADVFSVYIDPRASELEEA